MHCPVNLLPSLTMKNKITLPAINRRSIELEDVDMRDYPDFCDAYISYAEREDGTPLTNEELELLNEDGELVNDIAHEWAQ